MPNFEGGPKIQVIVVSDPTCIWCWGAYPQLRTLEWRFGEHLQTDEWMGGLIPDIRELFGAPADAEIAALNRKLASAWPKTVARHGMPVRSERFDLFDEEHPSGWPICYAVDAAMLQGSEAGKRMARRLREGLFLYGEKVNRLPVQIESATEVGLDIGAFAVAMKDGSAERTFRNDVQNALDYKVEVFPTWILRNRAEETEVLRGIRTYDELVAAIDRLTQGQLKPAAVEASRDELQRFLLRFGTATDAELRSALGYDPAALRDDLKAAERAGRISIESYGEQVLVRLTGQSA